jgi:hypothetical protein
MKLNGYTYPKRIGKVNTLRFLLARLISKLANWVDPFTF